jgi:hypothetical protein
VTHPVRIPADVDREDQLVANLTARQIALLAALAALLYAGWAATQTLLALPLFVLLAAPVAVAGAFLVVGRRDGLTLDRYLLAAARQRSSPRHRLNTTEPVAVAPAWLAAHATDSGRERGTVSTGTPLGLPARTVAPAPGGIGVVDLGGDGLAVVAAVSTVNFALATPSEQDGLVAVMARWLHALAAPVQILVRAVPVDLSGPIADLHDAAEQLPSVALARAARDHAAFLGTLGAQMQFLTRQVVLVLREPLAAGGPVDGLGGASPLAAARGRRATARAARGASEAARRGAHTRLARRLSEAVALLTPAGLTVTPLDVDAAGMVLAQACNPARLAPSAMLATPGEVITADAARDPDQPRLETTGVDDGEDWSYDASSDALGDDGGWEAEQDAGGWLPEIPDPPPTRRRSPADRARRGTR